MKAQTVELYEQEFTLRNRLGLHLRAANKVVRVASRFSSDVWLSREGMEVDAKSIMGLTLLAAACGSRIKVRARGVDARAAVEALGALINSKFEEED
jgi:phosphocarrier protein HPr